MPTLGEKYLKKGTTLGEKYGASTRKPVSTSTIPTPDWIKSVQSQNAAEALATSQVVKPKPKRKPAPPNDWVQQVREQNYVENAQARAQREQTWESNPDFAAEALRRGETPPPGGVYNTGALIDPKDAMATLLGFGAPSLAGVAERVGAGLLERGVPAVVAKGAAGLTGAGIAAGEGVGFNAALSAPELINNGPAAWLQQQKAALQDPVMRAMLLAGAVGGAARGVGSVRGLPEPVGQNRPTVTRAEAFPEDIAPAQQVGPRPIVRPEAPVVPTVEPPVTPPPTPLAFGVYSKGVRAALKEQGKPMPTGPQMRTAYKAYVERESAKASAPVVEPSVTPKTQGRFHGTSEPLTDVGHVFERYQSQNIYGPGFYTTNNRTVAEGYAKKGKGATPTIYSVEWTGDKAPNFVDLDNRLPQDAFDAMQDAVASQGITLDSSRHGTQLYKGIRERLGDEGMSRSDVEEILDSVRTNLMDRGYDGFVHEGGRITGGTPHHVEIYFDPAGEVSGKSNITISKHATPEEVTPNAEVQGQAKEVVTATPPAPPQVTMRPVVETRIPDVASVKNAVTKAQRAQLGLAPLSTRPRTPTEVHAQNARDLLVTRAVDGDKLAASVVEKPRPLDTLETHVLTEHNAKLMRDIQAASDEVTKDVLRQRFDVASRAERLAGTEQGRALQARDIEVDPFSNVELLLQKGRMNLGDKFDKPTQANVQTLYQRLQEGVSREASIKIRDRVVRKVVVRPEDFKVPKWGSENKLVTRNALDAARVRMRERAGRLNAGFDPTAIADLAVEIGYHTEAGVRFTYKTMRNYLHNEYGARDKDIQAAYQQAMNDKRLAASIGRQQKIGEQLRSDISTATPPAKVPDIRYSNEWVKQHKENMALRAELDTLTSPTKPLGQRVREAMQSVGNLPTGILAAWDDSFVLRQGAKMPFHQPKAWARGTIDSMRALKSEPVAWSIDAGIQEHPKFALAQQSGLEYTSLESSAKLASAEEGAMGFRVGGRIPVLGKALRPFDRAYTTAANVMRHEAFYRMADAMGETWTPEHYTAYASFLNKLTGRGEMGRLAGIQPELNAIFISPRKILADAQVLLTPFQGPKAVRMEAAKTLVRYTAALGSFAIVVNTSGIAKVGLNPDEPDFMKLRIGDTRFDLTAGTGSLVRTVWRAGQATRDYSKYGKARYKQDTAGDIVLKYLKNKRAPGISAAESLVTGKDFIGQPITPTQVGANLITPWNVNDVVEAWQNDGPGLGVVAGIGAFWGVSAQSYKDRPRKSGTHKGY